MATESPLIRDGSQTTAAADLSAKQFYAVQVSAVRSVNLETTGGKSIYGILQNKPKSGAVADVGILGISKAVIGAQCTAGNLLMTNTLGQLIPQTATAHSVAYALESATGTTTTAVIISVMVSAPGIAGTA